MRRFPLSILASAALAACLAQAPVSVHAQTLDLHEAYRLSLTHDATWRAAEAAAAVGRERLPQARAQLLPNLSASLATSANRLESRNGDAPATETDYPSHNETLTLRQALYRPSLTAGWRRAQAQVEDAEARLQQALAQLSVRVSEAYFGHLLARDQHTLVLQQLDTYTVQWDAARQALAAGAGTRTDVDEAQARLDLTVADALKARQQVEHTRKQLEALIQQPASALQGLDVARVPAQTDQPITLATWTAQAEAQSPELRALQAQLVAATEDVARARTGHLPTLDLIGQLQRSKSENVLNTESRYRRVWVGLQINVPIFSAGLVSSTVREAQAEEERVRQSLEALRRDLALRVHKEHSGVSEGWARLQALAQASRSAEQLVRSNQRSLQAGSRTLVDVFNAEQQRMVVLRDLAQARYQYLLARLRLQALAGHEPGALVRELSGYLER